MKKVLLISYGETTSNILYNQLNGLIGEYVEVESTTISRVTNIKGYDLVVFSSKMTYDQMIQEGEVGERYVVAERVINHKTLEEIIKVEEQKEVLFVNDSKTSTYVAIDQIKELGINHVEFIPYYPGCDYNNYKHIEIAVTPGEMELIPSHVKEVIQIGTRIISIRSIYQIINMLNLGATFKEQLTVKYIKDIVNVTKSIEKSRKLLKESEMSLEMIINNVDMGLVSTDDKGVVLWVNSKFENIAGKKSKDLIGKDINYLLEIEKNNETLLEAMLVDIEGVKYLTTGCYIEDEKFRRYLFRFEDTSDVKNKDLKLGILDSESNRKLLHDFSDYMTLNKKNLSMLNKAKMFSKTESNILIQGENGTGKEILAQAIHKNSYRKDKPFIPVNITAISENLLESELFGYEPGAFTGAHKNGKIGIFEKAKGGTIFIDEIGDAPKYIQTRLLRVIQEKRIRKIGSAHEIPVDVRILAATNKDLVKSMNKGEFREDLFFRLNVLPLTTIPLRYRIEDIKLILTRFLESALRGRKLEDIISDEVLKLLMEHPWKGNVRELQNISEYILVTYDDEPIRIEDLPDYMFKWENKSTVIDYNQFLLLKNLKTDQYIGRRTLADMTGITEGKMRGIIEKCSEEGYIEIMKKKGTKLSPQGKNILEEYMEKEIWK